MSSPKSIDTSTLVAVALIAFCLRGQSSTTASDLLRFEALPSRQPPRTARLRAV
jgi:hypothetical protein